MNFDRIQSAEKCALEVARDPSASEKHWMAACTLLEDKHSPAVRNSRRLLRRALIGLPWSMTLGLLSTLGAALTLSFVEYSIASILPGQRVDVFAGAHSVALMGSIFIAFSAVYTYQKYTWGGGRLWWVPGGAFVALLATIQFTSSFADAVGTPLLRAAFFIGLSLLTVKLTLNSIKNLDRTIGSNRVMPYARGVLASAGALCLALKITGVASSVATMVVMGWIPLSLLGSGYLITRVNKTADPQSASTMAIAAWNPLILSAMQVFGVLAVSAISTLFVGAPQVGLEQYFQSFIVAAGTLGCLTLGPTIGAIIGSRTIQSARELELHKSPTKKLSELQLQPDPLNDEPMETLPSPSS